MRLKNKIDLEQVNSPWITIIVVAFNSGDDLQNCINHIFEQTFIDFKVYIIDNKTQDNCISNLIIPDARFEVIQSKKNIGFSGGSNLGAASANSPYLMTLNPDVTLKKDFLQNVYMASIKFNHAAMFSPILLKNDDPTLLDGAGDVLSIYGIAWRGGYTKKYSDIKDIKYCEVFGPCGAAAIYNRDYFLKANGFDEKFFCYLEDVDLALRINSMGGKCILVPDALGYHIGGASTKPIDGFQVYHTTKNNLRMIIKSVPLGLLAFMLIGYIFSQAWIYTKNLRNEESKHRRRGYLEAFRSIPHSLIDRLKRKPYSIGASLRVASKLDWGKNNLKERNIKTWDINTGNL